MESSTLDRILTNHQRENNLSLTSIVYLKHPLIRLHIVRLWRTYEDSILNNHFNVLFFTKKHSYVKILNAEFFQI